MGLDESRFVVPTCVNEVLCAVVGIWAGESEQAIVPPTLLKPSRDRPLPFHADLSALHDRTNVDALLFQQLGSCSNFETTLCLRICEIYAIVSIVPIECRN